MSAPVSLHGDWLNDAAARIRAPRLREAVAQDARMRARIANRLAEEQGLPQPEAQGLDASGRAIADALAQDSKRLVLLAGLVWNAKLLARMITREALASVLSQFERKDLVFAMKLKDFAPGEAQFGYEAGKLKEFIEAAGTRCLVSWIRALPVGIGGRLRMSLPRALSFHDQAAALHPQLCADILLLAARNMAAREP